MKNKKIYVGAYGENFVESKLDYAKEMVEARRAIEVIKNKFPQLTTDDAYLLFRNSVSSVNTYIICEDF